MKKYRYINSATSIASYMAGRETTIMTISEYNKWCEHLRNILTTDEYEAIVFYGKRYLDELKLDDNGELFNIGDTTIRLAENKTKKDLDEHILAYVEADTLFLLLHAAESYKESQGGEDFSL